MKYQSFLGFWSYLWGIETSHIAPANVRSFLFWSYLWGIETHQRRLADNPINVLILPMRNWNMLDHANQNPYHMVLILPMRNLNFSTGLSIRMPNSFWSYLWGIETTDRRGKVAFPIGFWSYLWGIETRKSLKTPTTCPRFDLTYEELKLIFVTGNTKVLVVLILPMRNWNPALNG